MWLFAKASPTMGGENPLHPLHIASSPVAGRASFSFEPRYTHRYIRYRRGVPGVYPLQADRPDTIRSRWIPNRNTADFRVGIALQLPIIPGYSWTDDGHGDTAGGRAVCI